MTEAGLRRKLDKAFLLQAGVISLVAALSVYAAGFVLEEVLVKQALRKEADHFWQHYDKEKQFPRPDTLNLTGYLGAVSSGEGIPSDLRDLGLGFHGLTPAMDYSVVYVTEHENQRLVLVFDGESVNQLALYFGLVPLTIVLIVLYVGAWLAYRQSRQAVSPIIKLARAVHELDLEHPDASVFDAGVYTDNPNQEVSSLAAALHHFAQRINEFVDRERSFTRDASHELRSPLTVIKIAADMLLSEQELSTPARNSVERIKRSANDMEDLVGAFLLLARESEQGLSREPVCVNDLVAEEIERAAPLLAGKPIDVQSTADVRLVVNTSEKVLSVLIGNLIRNAFSYTDEGRVIAHVGDGYVRIEDSGIGIPKKDVERVFKPFQQGHSQRRGGFGVGLTIVRRLSDRFNWPVDIESQPEIGTRATVEFPGAQSEPLARTG